MILGNTYNDGSVKWKVSVGSGESTRVYSDSPIGTIIPYIVNNDLPEGYLICNGAAVSRTEYPDLYLKIGTDYGSGDGSTTFNLPDLRDRFLEGNTTAGTSIQPNLPDIQATWYNTRCIASSGSTYETYTYEGAMSMKSPWVTRMKNPGYAGASEGNSIQVDWAQFKASDYNSIYSNSINTVQPPAFTVIYLIRAYYTTDVFDHTHSNATLTEDGFMSKEDKDNIENIIFIKNLNHLDIYAMRNIQSASDRTAYNMFLAFLNYICDENNPYYEKIWGNNNTKTIIGDLNIGTVHSIYGYIYSSSGIVSSTTYGKIPMYSTLNMHAINNRCYHVYTSNNYYLYEYNMTQITQ